MKLKIYADAPKTEEVVWLQLRDDGDLIVLEAVDEDGKKIFGGNILTITSNGPIRLCWGVNSSLGFDLDDNGCVIIA